MISLHGHSCLSRDLSAEGSDRKNAKGDYYLTDGEAGELRTLAETHGPELEPRSGL